MYCRYSGVVWLILCRCDNCSVIAIAISNANVVVMVAVVLGKINTCIVLYCVMFIMLYLLITLQ